MKTHLKVILTILLILPVYNCQNAANLGNNNVTVNNNNKTVILNVSLDKTVFSSNKDNNISATLYNSEQIKQMNLTANCTVSFDTTTKKQTVSCPSGVEYKEVTPETFTFKLSEIKDTITLNSKAVKVGEKFKLNISGLSKDDCNNASASIEQTATTEQIDIKNLQWQSTLLGCINLQSL